MNAKRFDRTIDNTEHRYKILIQKVNGLEQSIDDWKDRHGADKSDRTEGDGANPATGPAGSGSGSGPGGAVLEDRAGISPVQIQTAAEGGGK